MPASKGGGVNMRARRPGRSRCRAIALCAGLAACLLALRGGAQEILRRVAEPRAAALIPGQSATAPERIAHLSRPSVAIVAGGRRVFAVLPDGLDLVALDAARATFDWRLTLPAELPGPPTAAALVPGVTELLPGRLMFVCEGSNLLHLWSGVPGEAPATRALPLLDAAPEPYVWSLSCDQESGHFLVLYTSKFEPRKPRVLIFNALFQKLAAVTLPLPCPPPFFAVWGLAAHRDSGGALRRGIVFPFGVDGHEGVAWLPCENTVPDVAACRAFRISGCPDRVFRAAAVADDALFLAGGQSDRLYAFGMPFEPIIPAPAEVSVVPSGKTPPSWFVCWNGAPLEGYTIEVSECGRPLGLPPVNARRGSLEVAGLLPGTPLALLLRSPDGRPGTFSATARIPNAWSRFDIDRDLIKVIAGIAYEPVRETLFMTAADGTLAACAFAQQIEPYVDAGAYRRIITGDVLRRGPAGHLSACTFDPERELLLFNGWNGRVDTLSAAGWETDTFSSPDVGFIDGMFAWDAAFSPAGELLIADPGGGRIVVLTRARESFRPSASIPPLGEVACPAGGPFGVTMLGEQVFFMTRPSPAGGVHLWSTSYSPEWGWSFVRPREVVPVEPGAVVTSLAAVQREKAAYLVVAGNDARGAFVLARALQPEADVLLHDTKVVLEAGATLRTYRLACSLGGAAAYTVAIRPEFPEAAGAAIACTALGERRGARIDEMLSVPSGDLVVRSYREFGSWIDVALTPSAPCTLRLTVIAGGVLLVGPNGEHPFLRGDLNANGAVEIGDAIATLAFLFRDEPLACCEDAADVNDDGRISIADPIVLLGAIFGCRHGVIAPPYPACGFDPTWDKLAPCMTPSGCVP